MDEYKAGVTPGPLDRKEEEVGYCAHRYAWNAGLPLGPRIQYGPKDGLCRVSCTLAGLGVAYGGCLPCQPTPPPPLSPPMPPAPPPAPPVQPPVQPPPSIPWVAFDNGGIRYCTASNPCAAGGTHCSGDSGCQEGLLCLQRSRGEWVPGVDTRGLPPKYDVCYDPKIADALAPVVKIGWKACTSRNPCGVGGTDCETDDDCEGHLKCYQRRGYEYVPGVDTRGLDRAWDVCYDPTYPPSPPSAPRRRLKPPSVHEATCTCCFTHTHADCFAPGG